MFFPYTVHMLCCQILNTISWKHDKIKPNLKKKNKQEKKCSNEHCTQFYTEIVQKISSGRISTENATSTTYYGKIKDSTISFHYKDEKKMFVQNAYISKLCILYDVTFNPEIGKKKWFTITINEPELGKRYGTFDASLRHLNSYFTDSILHAYTSQSHITSATESTRCLFNQQRYSSKIIHSLFFPIRQEEELILFVTPQTEFAVRSACRTWAKCNCLCNSDALYANTDQSIVSRSIVELDSDKCIKMANRVNAI